MRALIAVIVIFLCSCSEKRSSDLPRILVDEVPGVVKVNSKIMLRSEPRLLNINFKQDTTFINGRKALMMFEKSFPDGNVLPEYNFKVIIDTGYAFHAKGYVYERVRWPIISKKDQQVYGNDELSIPSVKVWYDRMNYLQAQYVVSYPVLIYNNSRKDAYLYHSDDFRLIQEALDSDGKWKPIEFQLSDSQSDCLSGFWTYKLLARHYIAASVIKYSGNFKTKIRIKLRNGRYTYYSNVIPATINKSQFDQSFLKGFMMERQKYYPEDFERMKAYCFLNEKG